MKIFLLVLLNVFYSPMKFTETTLTVEISNIKLAKGEIRIGVFKKGTKITGKADFGQVLVASGQATERAVFRVPAGRYAVAIYHDINNNKRLDNNFVGYPKEPFGFSNNFRPVISPPDFEDCAFDLKEGGTTVEVKLR